MKIKLTQDSRDLHYFEKFGEIPTSDFPLELNFDSSFSDVVQSPGDVECTCITTCDIASDEVGGVYDYQDLFNRIPHDSSGASPRDALGEAVKNGLLPKGATEKVKKFSSYWRCDTGSTGLRDYFDSVRSALILAQSPVAVATPWYSNWYSGVLPVGDRVVSGHMYEIEGWKEVNGQPHFIIEAWLGRKLLMPRETFNKAVSGLGCGAWVLSTSVIDSKRQISIMQKIVDVCINVILSLKQLILIKRTSLSPLPIVQENVKVISSDPYQEVKTALQEIPKYQWDTRSNIRHTVRVICDEEGLTKEQKDTMCATIQGESNFNLTVTNDNYYKGKLVSTDYGICQWNDYYHGKEITPDEAVHNPEKAVRLMCAYWKRGQRDTWIAYKSGSYKKYLWLPFI